MKQENGGVTFAEGFLAAGVEANIKYKDRKDMALVWSEFPAQVAGTFTTNVVKAAPVVYDQEIVQKGDPVRGVVLNSGIANACTGEEGRKSNRFMAEAVAKEMGVQPLEILTASTGVIGVPLVTPPIEKGAGLLKKCLDKGLEAGLAAAKAIMTTDTVPKEAAASLDVRGTTIKIGGMSKGSGMIHPNMATMLSVITTDADISHSDLQEVLKDAVKDSFNMISVDRDTSTNDTCLLLANGAAGISLGKKDPEWKEFVQALRYVTVALAKQMAADGEGANKLLEVTVDHMPRVEQARILAKSVITSNLVKTAVYGSDANWGRILCALGYAGVEFDPELVNLDLIGTDQRIRLVSKGMATDYSEEEATKVLSEPVVKVYCDMASGDESATAWGCDLTYEYVKINGDYRS